MILALDPSSSCLGYAIMRDACHLQECGRITPAKSRDAAAERIASLGRSLAELLTEVKPRAIVIEITSGKVARRLGKNVQGLGVYGMAVGFLWRECLATEPPDGVHVVEENVWTRGISKDKRTAAVAAIFRRYRTAADPGGDAADAIGIARWWLMNAKMAGKST